MKDFSEVAIRLYMISMIFVFSFYGKKFITRAIDAERIILLFPEKISG